MHRVQSCGLCLYCLSVCRLVSAVSPAKTAEPVKVPFWIWTQVGPGKHILCGGLVDNMRAYPDLPAVNILTIICWG